MAAPALRSGDGAPDLYTQAEALCGRARPGTIRLRVRSWERLERWLLAVRGHAFPRDAFEVGLYVHHLVEGEAAPSTVAHLGAALSWVGARCGHPQAPELAADQVLRKKLDWASLQLAEDGRETRKAPRLPVGVLLALEVFVCDESQPAGLRVWAWGRLVKAYGTLRWDDLQRVRPDRLALRSAGLTATLTRTKTTGAGKKVATLPLLVPYCAYLGRPEWLEVGHSLLSGVLPVNRDFLLPRPLRDFSGFGTKPADFSDAAAANFVLLAALRVPVLREGSWVPGTDLLLPECLSDGFTNHSERATLPSALACLGVSRDARDLLGRWGPTGSEEYTRSYRRVIRQVVSAFVQAAVQGDAYARLDEEDAVVDASRRLAEIYGDKFDPALAEELQAKLRTLARELGGSVRRDLEVGPVSLPVELLEAGLAQVGKPASLPAVPPGPRPGAAPPKRRRAERREVSARLHPWPAVRVPPQGGGVLAGPRRGVPGL